MPIRRSKKPWFWPVYISTTAIVILLILEVTARVFQLAPQLPENLGVRDPYLPFKPEPMSAYRVTNAEFRVEYRHNSFGFRDVEHTLIKPQGVFRILALGDSFTYGTGVALEDNFLSRLEVELNSRSGDHPRIEIIKAGIPRYFPEAERILLEHYGVSYSPDLVLVGFVPNDVLDTHDGIDGVKVTDSGYLVTREAQQTSLLVTKLYIHSHVFRILFASTVGRQRRITLEGHMDDIYRPNGFFELDWQKVEQEFETIMHVAQANEAQTVFVHIPQRGRLTEMRDYPAVRLSKWSLNHNAIFVDTLPALREAQKDRDLYYTQDGHFRPEGHVVIANILFKSLAEKQLVP